MERQSKMRGVKTIHVVPHSHDDVGWLKTVTEYFDGSKNDIQSTNVEVELTAIIDALVDNPKRKFSEVEIKFFSMWWDHQTEEKKDVVRGLVRDGQLEFINAGWSMHDEACPIYEDMVENMQIGHEFVLKNFGVKPRIGWQIDPFGHSNTNARIFAEMGFDAWFFARLDYQDKEKRLDNQEMEWIWRPNPESLGNQTQIFTHALYHHYSSPQGFDFDECCNDPKWINDENSEDYNAPRRAKALKTVLDQRILHYATEHIFMVFGGDFQFVNAFLNYEMMDNMIEYMNEHYGDEYFFRYSTPSDYVDAVAALNHTWPTKYDDMFPYSDVPAGFWTGYFSSRANDKQYARRISHEFHASAQLYTGKMLDQNMDYFTEDKMLKAKEDMMNNIGIMQHHDAVSGTAKQRVADDYAHRMYLSMERNSKVYSGMIDERVKRMSGYSSENWAQCLQTNTTFLDCPVAAFEHKESFKFNVAVQNPSSVDLKLAKLAVPEGSYSAKVFNTTS